MVFEILNKSRGINKVPDKSLNISKTNITFGEDIKEFLKDYPFVQIQIDKDEGLIGFKRTKVEENVIKIHSKSCSLRVPYKLKDKVPIKIYPVEIKEDMLIIEVPKEHLKDIKL